MHLIFIFRDEININDEKLKNVDTKIYGEKKDHVIWYHVKLVIERLFKYESVIVQAQILRDLWTLKKLKEATTLLGIQKSTNDKKREGKCDSKYKWCSKINWKI